MEIQTFNTLIKTRRSVFPDGYSNEKIEDSLIWQMLENANWAPTHKFTEPWRFVVFTGEGIGKLASFQAEFYKNKTEADGTFKQNRYENLLQKPALSSHIIAIGMKRDPKHALPEIEEVGAVFCAIQNLYLTAHAYGLVGYLSTGGITYFKGVNHFFGWEEEDKLLGFFHVGKPKGKLAEGKRTPIEQKVKWVNQ